MRRSVLISIQPYWVFLIIARAVGWKVIKEKTIELRKNYPKASDWDKRVIIYCSKNKKSFQLIPLYYQPLMKMLLGKVVGEFVCDKIETLFQCNSGFVSEYACVSRFGFFHYLGIPYGTHGGYDRQAYGWHISELKIYDEPKELSEFTKFGYLPAGGCCVNGNCKNYIGNGYYEPPQCAIDGCFIKGAPQSWCYVEV